MNCLNLNFSLLFCFVKLLKQFNIFKDMTPNEALDRYLNQFEIATQRIKTRDLRILLNKSHSVIYDWRHGSSAIDEAWQAKINEVLGENIFADCETCNK